MARRRYSKRGFTLVELLTVIAIIAILAAIIFPVMNAVKQKANQTKCMTNLMNIAKAVKMYKLDNRKFPDRLGPLYQDGVSFASFAGTPTDGCVMGEYIKAASSYRCPNSKNTDYSVGVPIEDPWGNNLVTKDQQGQDVQVVLYAVDDYDSYCPGGIVGNVRYTTAWATKNSNGSSYNFPPNDSGTGDVIPDIGSGSDADRDDYKRQLQWRYPPEDTVVTWCSYHNSGTKDLVLFLDGSVRPIDSKRVKDSKWRVRPDQ